MSNRTHLQNPMNQYSALKQALQPHLGWHGALNLVSSTVLTRLNQSQNRQSERVSGGIWR